MNRTAASRDTERRGRAGRVADRARAVLELPERIPMVGRVFAKLDEVDTMESAAMLAAQTFLVALPVFIAVAAFAPHAVQDQVVDAFGAFLGEDAPVDELQVANAAHGTAADAYGAIGILVTLISATTLSRALQRVCERCWSLHRAAAHLTAWRWLVWLLVWPAVVLCQAPLHDGLGAGAWLGVPVTLSITVLLWWWTQHLLLGGRIAWTPLVPGAFLTGVGMVALVYLSPLVMPRALEKSSDQFGPLGYAFTLMTWLIVAGYVIVIGLACGQLAASSPWFTTRTRT